ncbi:hypothetical protein SDC9_185250 [bioreactor metagenome]|uniref:Uncharacterized protein n=1 Tax=bioreactor metagenome TaxID=1076179 RepID=A0A645HHR1_9ZZZZ
MGQLTNQVDGVAIWLGLGHMLGSNDGVATGTVIHNEAVLHVVTHLAYQQSCDKVGRATGSVRNHDANRRIAGGVAPCLCLRQSRGSSQQSGCTPCKAATCNRGHACLLGVR